MCSVDEDLPVAEARSDVIKLGKKCMKCDETATLVTRIDDAFCRNCFQAYTVHKFRAAIGKSKLIRHGEKVLVAFSGGSSSLTMLHLVEIGLSESTHKKFRFIPGLLFVNDGCLHTEESITDHNLDAIVKHMKKSDFPCYTTHLEQCMRNISGDSYKPLNDDERTSPLKDEQAETTEEFRKIFNSFTSLSAKQEFVRTMRMNLIVAIAKREGYSKVMVGDCSTRLSVRLLTDIAQGKGAHIPLETHFADNRYQDITVIRPMKDFSVKEVAMYNHLHELKLPFLPSLTTKAPTSSSIEHLTEAFVTGLQNDFPSTVSNIVRTGEKLDVQNDKEDRICALCQAHLDTSVPLASALNAVIFSRKISGKTDKTCTETETSCCGEGDGACASSNKCRLSRDEIESCLCYACRLMISDQVDPGNLPQNVLEDILQRTRRKKMRSEIEDFLIDSSDDR